jgi:hypothetical protein
MAPRKDEGVDLTSPGVDEIRAAQLQKIKLLQERLQLSSAKRVMQGE